MDSYLVQYNEFSFRWYSQQHYMVRNSGGKAKRIMRISFSKWLTAQYNQLPEYTLVLIFTYYYIKQTWFSLQFY